MYVVLGKSNVIFVHNILKIRLKIHSVPYRIHEELLGYRVWSVHIRNGSPTVFRN